MYNKSLETTYVEYRGFTIEVIQTNRKGEEGAWDWFIETTTNGNGFSNIWGHSTKENAMESGRQSVDQLIEGQKNVLRIMVDKIERERHG